MNLLHTSDTKAMTWREELKNKNQCEFVTQSIQFVVFTNFCHRHLQSLQSIKTRRLIRTRKVQIREVWSSIRLRNQYRFAFACSRNRSFHHINLQIFSRSIFSTRFSFSWHIYSLSSHFFFCFRIYFFMFIAFALRLSASTTVCHVICVSINEFLRNVDRSKEMR